MRALRFLGNREFDAATLAASIATTPTSLPSVPFVGTKRCLDPVELTRDVQRLEVLYRRRGYPDVTVDTTIRTMRPLVIEVTFRIAEGAPLRVASVAIKGLEIAPEIAHAARDFPLHVGGVFDRGAFEAGRDSLVRRLRNVGWPQAEALLAYSTNNATHTADVEVTLIPGTRARLGFIRVVTDNSGGSGLSEGTIRRTMDLRSGEWFSARAIIDAQRNLYQTDAFRRVELQPDSLQPAGDSIVNLTATLVQGDRWAARGGIGWATLDCFRMQGSFTDRDFLPFAERLELEARVSKVGIGAPLDGAKQLCQGQARSDPYSATLNYYSSLTLRQPVRTRQSHVPTITVFSSTLSEYKAYLRYTPIGGALSLNNPIQAKYPSQLAYQLELGRTVAEPAFFCAVFNACEAESRTFLQRNSRLAALSYSIARTSVNEPLRPTAGTSLRLELRHASTAIGSSESQQFNKAVLDGTWYFAIGKSATRVISHVRIGQVYGGTTFKGAGYVPPQERLYAGGPTTVRGFRQNELGPAVYIVGDTATKVENGKTYFRADSGAVAERIVPTGGNSLVVGNLEVQMPSPFLRQLLQWAVFADAGRLWNRANTTTQAVGDEGRKIKVTPGAGVRIASPFGAIRIDLGYNAYQSPLGAAYFNAPLTAGVAPLYCVSPGNTLAITKNVTGVPSQASGACPATFRPPGNSGFLRRINPSIWIGQAF
ncbi:MAG: BamA/TamA family outer membrane protein [Gemmatimonadaceae bacterium]